ncbi:MAG: M23 family metallopeptidase [Bacteroidales bacterium]|nr:M23 family metallopeptidase [Bacteroidales bacterium]
MKKIKFKYDPESLSFEPIKRTVGEIVKKISRFLLSSLFFGIIISVTVFYFYNSPKEKQLMHEIENLEFNYRILNDRIEILNKVAKDLQERDDNLYRVIFESEPIAKEVRKSNYGDIDKYAKMDGFQSSAMLIETAKKVDILTNQFYVQSKSFDEVYTMAKDKEEMVACLPAIQPIYNKDLTRVSSGFGYRVHPYYKISKMHTGIDFVAPMRTSVYATGDGVVEQVTRSYSGYGNCIIINHGFGYKTLYAHLAISKVKVGQKVQRGDDMQVSVIPDFLWLPIYTTKCITKDDK